MQIVYNSYNGRYSDNPRAIYEALVAAGSTDTHVWLVDPRHRGGFPADVPGVPISSPQAAEALDAADLVVANCHLTLDPWTKRPGCTYLQTWHGTPLKRIHRAAVAQPDGPTMDVLDDDIALWDYLVTPSAAGTALLRSAFDYRGPVMETGYPRNDGLNAPGHEERRARVRQELGIAEDAVAVLYAPTYRDDDVVELEVPLSLDAETLAERLGSGFHLLLRRHYFLSHRRPVADSSGISDVSARPDATDLYLAADVLITDYSSAMFDFAVTGKPILLFAYDLEYYRDELRGFTLDLAVDAPGPILRTQAEVEAALLDLPALVADYSVRLYGFRERFCHLDDGHATQRVLDHLQPHLGGLLAQQRTV